MKKNQTKSTRRDFLRTGAAAGLIGISPKILWGADAPSNRINLCFCGCQPAGGIPGFAPKGGRGFEVMNNAATIPGLRVVAVCDPDRRATANAVKTIQKVAGNTPVFDSDIRKLLERKDIDAVFAEVPDHWHAPMAWMTMEAGKHIYCEKPCTFMPSEGDILVRVQRETGKVFQMGNQRRSSVAYRPAVEALRSGVIGEVKYARTWLHYNRAPIGLGKRNIPAPEWLDWEMWQGPSPRAPYRENVVHYNWHWTYQYGTSEIANSAVHTVDVAHWAMCLGMPTKLSTIGGRLCGKDDWEWPDTQMVSMEFADGKLLTWEGISCLPGKKQSDLYCGAMVYGTKGSMLFHPADYVVLYDEKGEQVREWRPEDVPADGSVKWKPKLDRRHILNFADAIRANDPTVCHSQVADSVRSSLIMHLGNISARSGEMLHLDASGKPAEKEALKYWTREYEPGWEHA